MSAVLPSTSAHLQNAFNIGSNVRLRDKSLSQIFINASSTAAILGPDTNNYLSNLKSKGIQFDLV